jgi:hypothetical protein
MTTKNVFTAMCLVLLTALNLSSQVLQESFDYPEGDSIGAHGWVHFSPTGAGALNRVLVSSPGLEYSGYQLPGVGNSAAIGNSGQDLYKPLSGNVNSGSVYTFFLVRVDSVRNTGDYFCAYLTSTSATNFLCRVYARRMSSAGVKFAFGLSKTTTAGGIEWTDTAYSKGTTYLIGMKYTFNGSTNTDDEVSLFVFTSGVPSVEPAPTIGPLTGTGNDPADIGRFALRQGSEASAPNLIIDEIYSGTGWTGTLPVELTHFSSFVSGRNVTLYWTVSEEINNSHFEIERIASDENSIHTWTKIGQVDGNGTSTLLRNYNFTDRGLNTGKYYYRLKQMDYNGQFEYLNLRNEVSIGIPVEYNLSQNYPNPFNPVTSINFDLPFDQNVSLRLYDISGREAASMLNKSMSAGYHSVTLDASGLSSGVYFYTLTAGSYMSTKKMLVVK